jgi:hypothetical protein
MFTSYYKVSLLLDSSRYDSTCESRVSLGYSPVAESESLRRAPAGHKRNVGSG